MLQVSQRHIDEILSNNIGDVRSAVLNLIFVSLRGICTDNLTMKREFISVLMIISARTTTEERVRDTGGNLGSVTRHRQGHESEK